MDEAIREQITLLTTSLNPPHISFKALVHNSIVEHCGLMQKREDLNGEDDNNDKETHFQEDIQQKKQDEQAELLRFFTEGVPTKQHSKRIAIVVEVTGCWSITAVDIYKRLLDKERNVDNTFAFNLIRPIGSVAGELIWPRSYDSSKELTFDENGAAYPLHERPQLSTILRRAKFSLLNGNVASKDGYYYYKKFS